ncbi:GPR1/FUN34/yaaH family-domain-containing protein [Melampsora americana]|nr:GPR1/FUN34/yaaH family-domain-containing protein [Melampsora americana]
MSDKQQYTSSDHHRKFANPAPLGLCGFAATTFLLSLFNVQSRGITTPNLIVGLAMGYGGLVQLLAGMWEFAAVNAMNFAGNTFGATAFSSYGGFWISFGMIFWPQSGILAAYNSPEKTIQLENALGLYLITWFIFTFIMLVASLRTSLALVALFFFLDLTFLILAMGKFYPETTSITKAGGVFGLITAFIAWYVAAANMLTPETSYFTLPIVDLSDRRVRRD